MKTIDKNDYIFLSGDRAMKTPLWHTVQKGLILEKDLGLNKLKLQLLEEETCVDLKKNISIKILKSKNKSMFLSYQHGFRIDQERIFTKHKNIVSEFNLAIHPLSLAKLKEIISKNPAEEFLKEAHPGDYVTVWSRPDEHQKDFLHYPVQGWLWSKNEETGMIEFLHPPKMDIQQFYCKNPNMMGYGFYRKLVYQLKSMDIKD